MPTVNELTILDVVRVVYRKTLFPELLEIFGIDLVLKLSEVFGGMKVFVPSITRLHHLLQALEIFHEMCYCNSETTVEALSKRYGISHRKVTGLYRKMRMIAVKHFNLAEDENLFTEAIATVRREPDGAKRKAVRLVETKI